MLKADVGWAGRDAAHSRAVPLWWNLFSSIVLLGVFIAFILGISLLLGWVSVNLPSEAVALDFRLYRAAVASQTPQITHLVFSLLNDPGLDYSVPIAICLGYVWWKRRGNIIAAGVAVALTLVIGAWTMPYTQWFGFRPRPFMLAPEVVIDPVWRQIWAAVPSFPSGHVRELAGLCLVLSHFWPRARVISFLYLVVVAVTRVYIGAHFATDVLAGLIIGLSSGAFSVLAVGRGVRVVSSISHTNLATRARRYLYPGKSAEVQNRAKLSAKAVRLALPFALVVLVAFVLGLALHPDSPRILADYLRNTDNSLAYPVLRVFDSGSAWLFHWTLTDVTKTYPVLVFLILVWGALRGKKGLAGSLALIAVSGLVSMVLVFVVSPHFDRPRPISTGEVMLPEFRRMQWPGMAAFPDRYLVGLTAMSFILARLWARARVLAYLYPILAAIGLMYFGAAWPTDAFATLVVGYLVAEYALRAVSLFIPASGQLWNDNPQSLIDDSASDG